MDKKKIKTLSNEELDQKIKKLQKRAGGILKANKILPAVYATGIATMIFMCGCFVSSTISYEKQNSIIDASSYNEVYEETLNEKLQSLENQLYNKEITPEEYVTLKKNAKGISKDDYISQYGTQEQKTAYKKQGDVSDKLLDISTKVGVVGTSLLVAEFATWGAASLAQAKRISTIDQLIDERKRRKHKTKLNPETMKKVMEIEAKEF